MYKVTKVYGHDLGLSCCFRQWRADGHCNLLHGYALAVTLEFGAVTLNKQNWVIDFGDLRAIKNYLVDLLDHTTLIADDDPSMPVFEELERAELINLRTLPHVGCEAFAEHIYKWVNDWLANSSNRGRVHILSVTVSEHGANSASYSATHNEVR